MAIEPGKVVTDGIWNIVVIITITAELAKA